MVCPAQLVDGPVYVDLKEISQVCYGSSSNAKMSHNWDVIHNPQDAVNYCVVVFDILKDWHDKEEAEEVEEAFPHTLVHKVLIYVLYSEQVTPVTQRV